MLDIVQEIEELVSFVQSPILEKKLQGLNKWRDEGTTHVVFCGEFKRGKSTLVNTLLGTSLSPTGVLPTTAVPLLFYHANSLVAEVEWLSGEKEPIEASLDNFSGFSVGGSRPSEEVRLVRVGLPSPILQEGLTFIDTPGVNDLSEQRSDVAFGFLPLSDLAVVVLDSTAPLTRSEHQFLTEQVFPAMIDNCLFVLGKTDRLDEDELEDAIEGAAERLENSLGRPVSVWPLSALHAKEGKDECFTSFRQALLETAIQNKGERYQLFEQRLLFLLEEVITLLEQRQFQNSMTDEEQRETSLNFQKVRVELTSRLHALTQYIESYGRETLTELVLQSLKSLTEELLTNLTHQIEVHEGDIEKFVQKEVPVILTRSLKQWSEGKGPEIQIFLEKLLQRVSEDFARGFQTPLVLSGLAPSLSAPKLQSQKTSEESSNKLLTMLTHDLLPTSVPMAAGALLLGPLGMVGGMVMGRVIQHQMRQNHLQEERTKAIVLIQQEVPASIEGFSLAMCEQIDLWFRRLDETLRQKFVEQAEQIQHELTALPSGTEKIEEALKKAQSLKNQLRFKGDSSHG